MRIADKYFPTPRRVLKPRRLIAASLILSFFFALTPAPARAQCCILPWSVVTDTDTTPAVVAMQSVHIGLLGTMNGLWASILATLTYLVNVTQPTESSAITSSVNTHGMLTSDFMSKMGDANSGNFQAIRNQSHIASYNADAALTKQTSSCAVQRWMQASEAMYTNSRALNGTHTALVLLGDCRGNQAACGGAGRTKEEFYDLCNLGFLPKDKYGDMLTDLACKDPTSYPSDQSYTDRHLNLSLFINTYQMPIAKPCILPDKYPYFSGTLPPGMSVSCLNGGMPPKPTFNADAAQSQLAWVAAYKFCELLGTPGRTPIYTRDHRAVTNVDIRKVMDDQRVASNNVNGAKNLCFYYLWERTAFPQTNAGDAQAVDGSTDAAADQLEVCKAMWTPPTTTADPSGAEGGGMTYPTETGMGIQSDPYLSSCANNGKGLSPLMMRKVMNYRCGDYNWLQQVYANNARGSANVEYAAQFQCPGIAQSFQQYVQSEEQQLTKAIGDSRSFDGYVDSGRWDTNAPNRVDVPMH